MLGAGVPLRTVSGRLGHANATTPLGVYAHFIEATDGEDLVLEGGGARHTLRVIHTPGHAANHLCLVLLEDGLLFSGDHILNGSTTVVDPPDGDMTAYLDSLDTLARACETHGLEFILPAHGWVLGFAREAIARLKAHRLHREGKIVAAMQARPQGGLEDWVELAYGKDAKELDHLISPEERFRVAMATQ